jgi:hypothetical protein
MIPAYAISLLGLSLAGNVLAEPTQAIGWIERVQLQPHKLVLTAKIDTGADNSSIHAENIEVYDRDGEQRVRFEVENRQGQVAKLDLPVERIAYIKRKGAASLERPVVNMQLCIGKSLKQVPINLASRSNFKYRILIGRSYLKDNYLVNAARQFTAEPSCQGALAQSDS